MYILLVDDNDEISDNLRLVLEIEGFQVRTVPCVSDAVQQIKQELPGLILADVVMPDQDGYDLFRMLRTDRKTTDVPFIFLSAAASAADLERYRKLGAEYITKPFALENLLAMVRRYIH
jgi:DNA-binding response OmpR family regulator